MEFGFIWFGLAVAVGIWASNRGRWGFGWGLLACLISPLLAAIFLAVSKNNAELPSTDLSSNLEKFTLCEQCDELISRKALRCKHCGSSLKLDPDLENRAIEEKVKSQKEETQNLWQGIALIVGLVLVAKIINLLTTDI